MGLRTEAFEYLQLPFKLTHGVIGRLQVQVPWQALRSPVTVELADVELRVTLRDEAELEEHAARARAWAAKQAALAAAGLAEGAVAASAPVEAKAQEGGGSSSKGVTWSFLQHIVALFVKRLQLSVRNVHICFEVRC